MGVERVTRGWAAALLLLVLGGCGPGQPEAPSRVVLPELGVRESHLTPEFWIARLAEPDAPLASRAAIETQNRALLHSDPSMYDLDALQGALTRGQVAGWIRDLADPPTDPLYGTTGDPVPPERLADIIANRNLDAIPASRPARFGLVVERAAVRTFPTDLRVFRSPDDRDIDRFQENALFPGTPVVIAHESADGEWWFVVSPRYAAWIEKRFVGAGAADTVLAWSDRQPHRIVTGATVETVFTPEEPRVSRLQLDMGLKLPVLGDRSAGAVVNGQHPFAAHVVELPVRDANGALELLPALLPRTADTADDHLPLTRGNVIRQSFKFLGERYGWGHSYGARDCSGFVSEVYRSMGVTMPRNTSAQSVSPALTKRLFDGDDTADSRSAAIDTLDVGDLVYIPGHVMMVIGHLDDAPWVIHDTTGFSHLEADGRVTRVHLNGVSVTPLLPLHANATERYVDRMTSIVRVAPQPDRGP